MLIGKDAGESRWLPPATREGKLQGFHRVEIGRPFRDAALGPHSRNPLTSVAIEPGRYLSEMSLEGRFHIPAPSGIPLGSGHDRFSVQTVFHQWLPKCHNRKIGCDAPPEIEIFACPQTVIPADTLDDAAPEQSAAVREGSAKA